MKVLIVNSNDILGGAAIAAYRLHKGLQKANIDSFMLVQNKLSDDNTVIGPQSNFQKGFARYIRPELDKIRLYTYKKRSGEIYSPSLLNEKINEKINEINPDIVHLHWINNGFIKINSLKKIQRPILWTMHDMWAYTGGCHYSGSCEKYKKQCGACAVLGSGKTNDLSRKVYKRKAKTYKNSENIVFNGLSRWIAECGKESSLLKNNKVVNLPNCININDVKPIKKQEARYILNIPQDKKLILFGAMSATSDKRKGYEHLVAALQFLKDKKNIELMVFGASKPVNVADFGIKANYLGRIHDEVTLNVLYSAADVMIVPSLQENLSNAIMESLACGTPVVGYDIGGNSDMIIHKKNGYLAKEKYEEDLANGINFCLNQETDILRNNAREYIVNTFAQEQVIPKYLNLYNDML